ncbi:MAG: ATP-binding cassette domain-containing protein [Bifidobacteriaceae bacterium]|jgi:ATPase subunit of ABC transporter with duplicated ATPase domains|nr:ATP-binding cassette domain-containing protein [Bifidobacteriaceae bacterium]
MATIIKSANISQVQNRGDSYVSGSHLKIHFPTKDVFDDVSASVHAGDRIAIVGANGEGKSTLMKMLCGVLEPDGGDLSIRRDLRIGFLGQADGAKLSNNKNVAAQNIVPQEKSDAQNIVAAQKSTAQNQSTNTNQNQSNSPQNQSTKTVQEIILGDYEYEYEWASDSKIRSILDALISDIDLSQDSSKLSGGQAQRVSLAALLIKDWDVIALDEPTNHLDMPAIKWLAGHINSRWRKNDGAFLIVTHDRWFLDEVANLTWEVHDGICETFDGGYSAYILGRAERDKQAAVVEGKRQNLMKKELAWLSRGAPARTAKPKFRIEAANELIADEPPPRSQTELVRLATSRLGKQVVDLEDVTVTFKILQSGTNPDDSDGTNKSATNPINQDPSDPENTVLNTITWSIGPGDRIGILGANGAGKSTLLSVITGKLDPTVGRVKIGKTVKFASLTQRLDELEKYEDTRVREIVAQYKTSYIAGTAGGGYGSSANSTKEMTPSQMLERLGFKTSQLQSYVKDLSGGQRRRLQLLLILLDNPNVLILDEPSNDLDTDMLAVLEDLLDWWPGTLLVVSHDRYLVERVTDSQFALVDGSLKHMPGGVDEYMRLVNTGASADRSVPDKSLSDKSAHKRTRVTAESPTESATESATDLESRGKSELSTKELQAIRKKANLVEGKLKRKTDEISQKTQDLENTSPDDYEALINLGELIKNLKSEQEELELEWLELTVD